jgi:uncharacterized protein
VPGTVASPMAARLPLHPAGIELGVALDLPWDVESRDVIALLDETSAYAAHLSLGWQPGPRPHVEARDSFPAYDDFFAHVGARFSSRSLHHSARSRGAIEAYREGELLEVTNALVDRYGFAWVTEDAGLWPIQPDVPDADALASFSHDALWGAARHARVLRAGLEAPLVLDFPRTRAYDFFRALADEADVDVSLDTATILADHPRGRGTDSFEDIERLPLARCFELRVSARAADSAEGSFDAELECIERLVGLCPNLRVIVYEAASGAELRAEGTVSALLRLRDAIESRGLFRGDAGYDARV